jgi:hypothetical protein
MREHIQSGYDAAGRLPRGISCVALTGYVGGLLSLATLMVGEAMSAVAQPAPPSPPVEIAKPDGRALEGNWTYRSYRNDANIDADPNNLLFGKGIIHITEAVDGTVTGTLGGPSWSLALQGKATYQPDSVAVKMQGSGNIVVDAQGTTEFWVYDYFGYLAPNWSNGVKQRPAILGTVVRAIPHSNGAAPAGIVASFLAVKQ